MQDLDGKIAFVTGGSSGIGLGLVKVLAAAGMKVAFTYRQPQHRDEALAHFAAHPGQRVHAIRLDVTERAAFAAAADEAEQVFGGPVQVLINNAGVGVHGLMEHATYADWDWVMGVNFYGVTHALRAFVPTMLKHGEEGHIVNTASMAGLTSQPSLATYNASKHAVVTVSEGLHHDLTLRQSLIKVSVLCPGWVKTGVAHSERNRAAAGAGNDGEATPAVDAVTLKVGMSIMQAVQNGIPVAQVADEVFDAIAAERFYILTHPEMKQAIQIRMEDILQQRAPTLLRI